MPIGNKNVSNTIWQEVIMYCPNCGNPLADGAQSCDYCEGTLILAKSRLSLSTQTPQPSSVPAPHQPHFLYEQVWQTLADFQLKQQDELTRLRAELEGKLHTLVPKSKPEDGLRWRLRANAPTTIILSVVLAGLLGFGWVVYKLLTYRRDIRFDNLAITATLLTVLGGLYLAYDLLGRQRGPLRWITLFVTSGLLGGFILEPIAIVFTFQENLFAAFRIILIGVMLGAFSGILFAAPEDPRHPHIFSGKASLIGGVLTSVFLVILLSIFFTPTAADVADTYLQIMLVATLLGMPSGIALGGFHHFFRDTYRPGRPAIFSWRSSLKALGVIVGFWIIIALLVLLASNVDKHVIYQETLIVLAVSLAGAVPSGFAPYVFWWINHLPERVVGASGVVLTLIGSVLPVIQPVTEILSKLSGGS